MNPKLVLTIILVQLHDGMILARGIIQDATVFEHVAFTSHDELAKYAASVWLPKYIVRTTWAKGLTVS